MKQLIDYQWLNPPWDCRFNINEYWEAVKYAVIGETDKFCIVTQSKATKQKTDKA